MQGEKPEPSSWHSKEATPLPPGSEPEGEGGVVVGGGARRAGEDGGLGGGGVDGEGAAGGALVGVAGLVDRPDLEAVGEVGVGLGRGAGGEAGAVELAFEGGDAAAAGVRAREGEGGVDTWRWAGRAGEDGGLGGGGVER